MNTLYHFGDSFATSCKSEFIFTKYMADMLSLNWKSYGRSGTCNEQIFSKILDNLYELKKGDLLIINWSYFSRISYVSADKLRSANELHPILRDNNVNPSYKNFLLDYALKFNYDNAAKIFKSSWLHIQNHLDKVGVHYIQTILSNDLFQDGIKLEDVYTEFYELRNVMVFPKQNGRYMCYENWLESLNWKNEECSHYTLGIQPKLAKVFTDYYKSIYPPLL